MGLIHKNLKSIFFLHTCFFGIIFYFVVNAFLFERYFGFTAFFLQEGLCVIYHFWG